MSPGDADERVIDLVEAAGAPVAKVYGEPLLELPTDLYIPPEALEVFLESFEGPLDLLLYLIRKQNINVLDVPMAELTRQYLGYVEMMRRTQLELALVKAAAPEVDPSARALMARIERLEAGGSAGIGGAAPAARATAHEAPPAPQAPAPARSPAGPSVATAAVAVDAPARPASAITLEAFAELWPAVARDLLERPG